ncbi:MAG TPA: universal stress protein, partial [Solirubrobacteraceae bacterium]|nr:universal stress protein [Solirubrobacteraceae bacterium]
MHDPPALRDPILAGLALEDGDGPVLRIAGELARLTGAPLALLHARPAEPAALAARDPARAALERAAAPLRAAIPVTLHVRASPSPVRALHEAAEELGASLVVAGGGAGGVGERLLHAAPCAV